MKHSIIKCAFIIISFLISTTIFASSTVDRAIHKDIKKAQKNLNITEKRISTKRSKLVNQLNRLENDVLKLQQKTSVARRLADEKTLSLTQLEQRLSVWREQQAYQQNLINRFLRQYKLDATTIEKLSEQIEAVVSVGSKLEKGFHPSWNQREVVMENGKLRSLETLSLGPVTWYWQEQERRVGIANIEQFGLKAGVLLNVSDSENMEQLITNHHGVITFDPTLNKALLLEQHSETLVEHITRGGLWVVPILLFAVFALSIVLVKGLQLLLLPKIVRFTPHHLQTSLGDPSSSAVIKIKGMQKELLHIFIKNKSSRILDDQLFLQLQKNKYWLERWIGAIAITASISPLLGLLGTVSGMIETFKMMTLFGSGDPEVVSGGIAQALITTELGLVVAIPSLIFYAILSRRAKSYYSDLEGFAILLSQPENKQEALPDQEQFAAKEQRVET